MVPFIPTWYDAPRVLAAVARRPRDDDLSSSAPVLLNRKNRVTVVSAPSASVSLNLILAIRSVVSDRMRSGPYSALELSDASLGTRRSS
jgi:hypothetical protein